MGITHQYETVPETEVHSILKNERRRLVIEHMRRTVGSTTLRELAEAVAEKETGESPPPANIRKSVYNSLHQTHLPKLDRCGVLDYDSDRKTISLNPEARSVDAHLERIGPCGIAWGEFYRGLGTVSLVVILATLVDAPIVSAVDPVLVTTLFLFAFAVSAAYQMWARRWLYVNALFS